MNPNKGQWPRPCPHCGVVMKNSYFRAKHFKETHPDKLRKDAKLALKAAASPLDVIHEHERGIRKALQTLETERDQLHARIVEIDNLCAKYKKFEATTGNGH